jgi:hypothetical protein
MVNGSNKDPYQLKIHIFTAGPLSKTLTGGRCGSMKGQCSHYSDDPHKSSECKKFKKAHNLHQVYQ